MLYNYNEYIELVVLTKIKTNSTFAYVICRPVVYPYSL